MKKKTKTKNGNTAQQELKSTNFFKEFQEWKELEGVDFILRHGIKSSNTVTRRTGMETIEGASRGHRDHLPRLMEIMDYDDFIGTKEIDYLKAYLKFIDAAKGTKADPAMIPYHINIYDKSGKNIGKRKVYGHWKTAEFVKYSKKFKGDTPVPKSWYSYDVNNPPTPPPHQVVYSKESPKGLKYILEDALKELEEADITFEITRVSNPKELYKLSQVKQFLESQLTPALVKEGVINAKAIAGKLASQKFGVTGEAEEAIVRRLSGFSEEEVTGDVEEFTVKVSPAIVERAYLASTKKKVGGFYIHGKVVDKRPRKEGVPVAKSWLDIVKRTENYPQWLAMLVEYDLPIAIAKQLRPYMQNLVNRGKSIELSAKLSRLHQFSRGAKIGSISREIEKLVMKYDRPTTRGGVHPNRTEDINLLTEPQLEQVAKYTIHLIEQA
tara:strand:- start:189 stop:1505 length:1317 start_codon:yes stop_codon:yes gene_type:complete